MFKLNKNKTNTKTNRKVDAGKIIIKIVSLILAALMVLSVSVTLIYYMVNM